MKSTLEPFRNGNVARLYGIAVFVREYGYNLRVHRGRVNYPCNPLNSTGDCFGARISNVDLRLTANLYAN
jgi:hypothetical protein